MCRSSSSSSCSWRRYLQQLTWAAFIHLLHYDLLHKGISKLRWYIIIHFFRLRDHLSYNTPVFLLCIISYWPATNYVEVVQIKLIWYSLIHLGIVYHPVFKQPWKWGTGMNFKTQMIHPVLHLKAWYIKKKYACPSTECHALFHLPKHFLSTSTSILHDKPNQYFTIDPNSSAFNIKPP